jgi:hypothetical protein
MIVHKNNPDLSRCTLECDRQSMKKGDLERHNVIPENMSNLKHVSIHHTCGKAFTEENDLRNREVISRSDPDSENYLKCAGLYEGEIAEESRPNLERESMIHKTPDLLIIVRYIAVT